jgi:hypothetical protein
VIKEKIDQARNILREENIDLWLTFVRESEAAGDPVLDLILGEGCTWHSAFIIPVSGDAVAIVGSLDEARIRETGAWDVVGYKEGIGSVLIEHLDKLDPSTIAINFSENDVMADGLSHGMYLTLMKYLSGTKYEGSLVS